MNLQNILTAIEQEDAEVYSKLDTRRKVMKNFASLSGKIALTAIPMGLASMFQKAYGGTTSVITDVLNFALTLEYIESEFYKKGVSTSGLIAGEDMPAFETINKHEKQHVKFLTDAIIALGGTPVYFKFSSFDYTAKGNFPKVFSDYATFLAVSQTFEDTGVRAYKGQAPNLMSSHLLLNAALRIHSVEGRHAAHLRKIRRKNGLLVPAGVDLRSWITLNQSGIGSPVVQPSYNGEQLTTQAGINIVNINGQSISAEAASESFDEPLTKEQVIAIVTPFFA